MSGYITLTLPGIPPEPHEDEFEEDGDVDWYAFDSASEEWYNAVEAAVREALGPNCDGIEVADIEVAD